MVEFIFFLMLKSAQS